MLSECPPSFGVNYNYNYVIEIIIVCCNCVIKPVIEALVCYLNLTFLGISMTFLMCWQRGTYRQRGFLPLAGNIQARSLANKTFDV